MVRGRGAEIVGIGVIVLRQPFDSGQPFDSAQNDKGRDDVPTHVLLDLPLLSYDAAECPQCLAGKPMTDPGSRRS